MLLVASLISPEIWFVPDMQTENARTLMCSQYSWVSDTQNPCTDSALPSHSCCSA